MEILEFAGENTRAKLVCRNSACSLEVWSGLGQAGLLRLEVLLVATNDLGQAIGLPAIVEAIDSRLQKTHDGYRTRYLLKTPSHLAIGAFFRLIPVAPEFGL